MDVLKRSRPSKVGLAGFGRLSAATYIALKKGLPDVEFVDVTDIIDELKAVKSEEEIEYIRKTAEMHDKVWEEVVMRVVRPGKKPLDVIREVWNAMMKEGNVMGWYRANASPPDIPCQYFGPLDRVIKEGDVFAMLMEFSGPEGYYCEIMRNVCLGRIPRELEEAFEDVKEAQSRMAKKLLPNTDPNEVLKEGDGLMREKGWPVETRLAGHGQGLDLVERPAISPISESMKLKKNMVLALHPTVHAPKAWGILADNFLVTETGGVRLQRLPQELFIL